MEIATDMHIELLVVLKASTISDVDRFRLKFRPNTIVSPLIALSRAQSQIVRPEKQHGHRMSVNSENM